MKNALPRIKSGIKGLDEIIEGGFPFPSTILLAGYAGSGKTTFVTQFLNEGAKHKEQGLFFTTLSEPTQWMLRFMSSLESINPDFFGNEIKFIELGPVLRHAVDYNQILEVIDDHIAQIMPQRVVIDPITVLEGMVEGSYRQFQYELSCRLKNWQATSILTGEVVAGQQYPSEIAYTADAVLILSHELVDGQRKRYLEVMKMRGTKHATNRFPVTIGENGLVVESVGFI